MVDRIRWDTVSYLPFYYVFFQFLLLTIFNLQANILTAKDIFSNLEDHQGVADDQPLAVEVYLLKLCSYLQLVCFGVLFVLPCYCDEGEIAKMLQ